MTIIFCSFYYLFPSTFHSAHHLLILTVSEHFNNCFEGTDHLPSNSEKKYQLSVAANGLAEQKPKLDAKNLEHWIIAMFF